jgi:hypothetical protein
MKLTLLLSAVVLSVGPSNLPVYALPEPTLSAAGGGLDAGFGPRGSRSAR